MSKSLSSSQSLKQMTPTKNATGLKGDVVKGIVSGLTYYVVDTYVLNNVNQNQSIGTSSTIALSSFTSSQITTSLPDLSQYVGLNSLGNGKMVGQRICEVGINAGSAYVVNQYFHNIP